jgi:hypothetical protein
LLARLGTLLIRGYVLLLTVAAGGLVGANVAAFVPVIREFFFNPEERATPPAVMLGWLHGGWLVGAGLALAGAVLHRRRSAHRAAQSEQPRRPLWSTDAPPRGVLASIAGGAAGGGLLGALLGATFLLLWFSLTYSPFFPGLDRTIKIERDRTHPRLTERPVHTSTHPVAVAAFFIPTALGVVGGAVLGGVGRVTTEWKRRP